MYKRGISESLLQKKDNCLLVIQNYTNTFFIQIHFLYKYIFYTNTFFIQIHFLYKYIFIQIHFYTNTFFIQIHFYTNTFFIQIHFYTLSLDIFFLFFFIDPFIFFFFVLFISNIPNSAVVLVFCLVCQYRIISSESSQLFASAFKIINI